MTDLSLTTAPKLATSRNSMPRRWPEGILFVAIWMGMGWSLALDPYAYLVLGIPLTFVFQRFVHGAPFDSWVREAPPFGMGWLGPAAVLAILPAYSLIRSLGSGPWAFIAYLGAALIGAIAAGYALRNLRRETIRPFLMCHWGKSGNLAVPAFTHALIDAVRNGLQIMG